MCWAQNLVSEKQAALVCQRFVNEKQLNQSNAQAQVKLQEVVNDEEGMTCLYHFSIGDKGFVVVSASQKVLPVLAYSFDEDFEMIPPVEGLFHLYKQVVRFTEEGKAPVSEKSVKAWKHYLSEDFAPQSPKTPTRGPLLTTRWNQNLFYNTYCPWDVNAGSYYDYRVPNGCVALACAQIMNYHRYPEHGTGASTYLPSGYPRQTVYFSHHTYHWDAMCNQPMSYANEISKLAYHVGVAIQMQYTPDGSGAYYDEAKQQLESKFGYDQNITVYYRNAYNTEEQVQEYVDMLKGEIDARRPVFYSGHPQYQNSGHAYVLDGYDEEERFHLNYGWGGSSNGFYAIDNFVAGINNYDYDGRCIVRIYPSGVNPDTYCQGHQRNTASFGYVADGSPTTKPYQANPDCSWMVAVPDASSYTFTFDRLDLNPNVDFVTIYNGPTIESGVKATFTGSEVPSDSYQVEADSVLITFTSNGTVSANTDYYGFLISYTSEVAEQYCSANKMITDWHAELSDESPENTNYRAQTVCSWLLNLQYIKGFYFNFPKFDLGYGDFVDVYNASTNPPTFYKRFDIYEPPTGIEQVNFKKMKVTFVADNWDQKDGFKMEYFAIDGVDDFEELGEMSIYPNPASDNLFVDFSMEDNASVAFRLVDAAGKLVSMDKIAAVAGDNHYSMNVSALSPGFYMLEISTDKGKTLRKVMVQ